MWWCTIIVGYIIACRIIDVLVRKEEASVLVLFFSSCYVVVDALQTFSTCQIITSNKMFFICLTFGRVWMVYLIIFKVFLVE